MIINNPAVLNKILNIRDQTGFGCGEDNPIGFKMQFLTDYERIYSQVTVPPTMAGWDQTVHGGIISTIMDEIMGRAVIYFLKKIAVTKSITVDFIKPLYVGTELSAVSSIQEIQSERQVLVTGEIYSDEDTLCAKANVYDIDVVHEYGIDAVFSVLSQVGTLEEAFTHAAANLRAVSHNIAAALKLAGALHPK